MGGPPCCCQYWEPSEQLSAEPGFLGDGWTVLSKWVLAYLHAQGLWVPPRTGLTSRGRSACTVLSATADLGLKASAVSCLVPSPSG